MKSAIKTYVSNGVEWYLNDYECVVDSLASLLAREFIKSGRVNFYTMFPVNPDLQDVLNILAYEFGDECPNFEIIMCVGKLFELVTTKDFCSEFMCELERLTKEKYQLLLSGDAI